MSLATTVPLIRLTSISVIAVLSLLSSVHAQEVQKLPDNSLPQPINPNAPNNLRPTGDNSGLLSFDGGKRLMAEANNAVSSQNYQLAAKKLQEARQVYNQLSNFYEQLNSSFSGIDNRVADTQRKKALEAAQMRDEATYQLALVHRAQNQPELAVPLLVQIIKSQNPTRDLGKKAYQQLFELGFVDAPFTVGGGGSSGSPSKGSANTPFPSSSSGGNNTPTPRKRK
jgi:tetratricopeptide (TPR) repeat protein